MKRKTIYGFTLNLMLLVLLCASAQASMIGDELTLGSPLFERDQGLGASLKNPARMLSPQQMEFALQSAGTVGINAWNIKTLGLLGESWDDEDRERIGAGVGPAGLTATLDAAALAGFRFDQYGLRVGARALGSASVPKELTDLAFYGLDLVGDFQEELSFSYDLKDVDGWGAAFLEASAAAAYSLPTAADRLGVADVRVGAAVKYLQGLAYASADLEGEMQIDVTDNGNGSRTAVEVSDLAVGYFTSNRGRGLAVDLGVSVDVDEVLTVDAAVNNIGAIRWQGIESSRSYLDSDEPVTLVDFSFATDPFSFAVDFEEDVDMVDDDNYYQGDAVVRLPVEMRLGASYKWSSQVTFAGQLTHTRFLRSHNNRTMSRIDIGGEYRPLEMLPLRASITAGTAQGLRLNTGFGFRTGPFRLDASINNVAGLLLDTGTGTGFGLQMALTF